MARKDALVRLYKRLEAQRDELRRKLSLPSPSSLTNGGGGDVADMAASEVERELESQLVSLESRELGRIQKALDAIQNGTYGTCERCGAKIPIARLQALPHTSSCVDCQRHKESRSSRQDDELDWESAWNFQSAESDRELTMRDLRLDVE